jgi:hypothetical protein
MRKKFIAFMVVVLVAWLAYMPHLACKTNAKNNTAKKRTAHIAEKETKEVYIYRTHG